MDIARILTMSVLSPTGQTCSWQRPHTEQPGAVCRGRSTGSLAVHVVHRKQRLAWGEARCGAVATAAAGMAPAGFCDYAQLQHQSSSFVAPDLAGLCLRHSYQPPLNRLAWWPCMLPLRQQLSNTAKWPSNTDLHVRCLYWFETV